jgi:predicted DNA-binding transcriptional regulator YafY
MYNQQKLFRVLQLINLLKRKPAKTIRSLAAALSCTERTAYRYLHLIAAVGFDVQKDAHNRIFIATEQNQIAATFTVEELSLLKELLNTAAKHSHLKDGILEKLQLNSEVEMIGGEIIKVYLSKIVQQIKEALRDNKRIILRKYHSLHSNKVSDRIVEPICFTDNYNSLVAYEVKTRTNKYFNIERITQVEVMKQKMKFNSEHRYAMPDLFGFSDNGVQHDVELTLTLRAAVLLREEYPSATPCISLNNKTQHYNFKAVVHNFIPLQRFITGLPGEIQIIKPPALREIFDYETMQRKGKSHG